MIFFILIFEKIFIINFYNCLIKDKCNNVGPDSVFYDPTCSISGYNTVGCNAGNQGQNCRFCGPANQAFPCPITASTLSTSTASSTFVSSFTTSNSG